MSHLREFLEDQLFKSLGNQRFTQDSPVYPDVWLEYAMKPSQHLDLLLTPTLEIAPPELASLLSERLRGGDEQSTKDRQARIAPNMTTVAARLTFRELVGLVLPMTQWWDDYLWYGRGKEALEWFYSDPEDFSDALGRALRAHSYQNWIDSESDDRKHDILPTLVWLSHVAGTILLVESEQAKIDGLDDQVLAERLDVLAESENEDIQFLARALRQTRHEASPDEQERERRFVERLKPKVKGPEVVRSIIDLFYRVEPRDEFQPPSIKAVNNNRRTESSLYRSGKATKSDAVRQVFSVSGRGIRWAVIDSGIDARHIAFRRRLKNGRAFGERTSVAQPPAELQPTQLGRPDPEGSYGAWAFCRVDDAPGDGWVDQTRILATYDFTRIRELLSARSVEDIPPDLELRVAQNRRRRGLNRRGLKAAMRRALKFGSMVNWGLLEDFIRVPHNDGYRPPAHFHGTHVAGILAGDWRSEEHELTPADDRTGIAPELELYDLRALDQDGVGDEFSIMAAMQFVRYLNLRKTGKDQMELHGANLSFSIKHEVGNFACGRTPVCDEADRLVGAGVVVVAAAGNQGRARYQTVEGKLDEGYRSMSITDPGNAHSVITVGATHSHEPHTYGISYFSSRGPTGDGRPKPDLVAPGESIYSSVPGNGEGNADGTSQAAPHVSGAAALLMERNVELIGDPDRIKRILCRSATDLGREKYFQGAGMLDVLRAMQSV